MGNSAKIVAIIVVIVGLLFAGSMFQDTEQVPDDVINDDDPVIDDEPIVLPTRESKIPDDIVKVTPDMDINPPVSYSFEYYDPVPVPGLVNTPGGEDSAFILPDGKTLYFFFTPDVRESVEVQVADGVTGIYVSEMIAGSWSDPERVMLQDTGLLAMDGCEYIRDDMMYFVSAREGYDGLHWFKAEQVDGVWCNWENADEELKLEEYLTGEMHITSDGLELYFHSSRSGGLGEYDIWVSNMVNGSWDEPVNVAAVNTEHMEGWPFITEDGSELWYSYNYGLWRSKRVDGVWQSPEKMFGPLTGESSMDLDGSVYFTHHFYENDTMLEADIYVAYRKHPLKGVSLTPRNSSSEYFGEFMDIAHEAGGIVRWAADWMHLAGETPITITELGTRYNYSPLVEVSPQSNGALIRELNETVKGTYLQAAVNYSIKYQPKYLGLATEINNLYEENPEDFTEFVELYNQVYDAVKAVSPDTLIYPTFQLESMKGYTYWSTDEPGETQWWMIGEFKHDMVGFTTYPDLIYKSPQDMPANYYSEITNYTSKPLAFTEMGWHSEASPIGWESDPDEQAEYVAQFVNLTEGINVEMMLWSFMYDPLTVEPFRSMGFYDTDGNSRPSWEIWTNLP